jgi:hypothetical protein
LKWLLKGVDCSCSDSTVRFANQLDFGPFVHDLHQQKDWGALLASEHMSFCAGDPDNAA